MLPRELLTLSAWLFTNPQTPTFWYVIKNKMYAIEAVVAQRNKGPLEEIKYLLKFIFPFLRSGVKAKRGVEFCHSIRNASRIRQKVGNGVS